MFAYLIVAAELAILYTVFWYIFLREPRPFSVHPQGNLWGRYDGANMNMRTDDLQADPMLPIKGARTPEDWMTLNETLYSEYCGERSRRQSQMQAGTYTLPIIDRNPALKYGWVMAEQKSVSGSPRWLLGFRKTVEELRVQLQ